MRSKTVLSFGALLALSAPAIGAPSSPPSVQQNISQMLPITLSGNEVTALANYLGTLPYNQAAPIMQLLGQKEAAAKASRK
jgi:hypothetical protein